MKVSVITVAYNSETTIADTAESVLGQAHGDIEYILIDGGSSDGNLPRLEPCKGEIASIISEPDDGMYDAMNKGTLLGIGYIFWGMFQAPSI